VSEREAGAERILAAVRALRRGETASYGEMARRAGLPRRARLVARVLAQSDEPGLPWHRVLRADGRIAFAAGSDGHRRQLALLKAEGIEPGPGLARRQSATLDLDRALWAQHD
jgi:methylated-DNA-protein-cysteine methyltransferase-like protein